MRRFGTMTLRLARQLALSSTHQNPDPTTQRKALSEGAHLQAGDTFGSSFGEPTPAHRASPSWGLRSEQHLPDYTPRVIFVSMPQMHRLRREIRPFSTSA